MTVTHLTNRIVTMTDPHGTRIHIGPPRQLLDVFVHLVGMVILSGPYALAFAVARGQLRPDIPRPLALAFLIPWTVFSVLWFWRFLWNLFGREELHVSHDSLTRQWTVGPLRRTRRFSVADVTDLRLLEVKGPKTLVARRIVFNYLGRTVTATAQLSPNEALSLLAGPLHALASKDTPNAAA